MRLTYFSLVLLVTVFPALNAYAEGEQAIEITILGKPQIDIGSQNMLLRANVIITNFDPADGHYTMQITQISTQKVIYEKEVQADVMKNEVYGMPVAYLVDEKALSKEGEVTGEYEILITSYSGSAVGKANFSIIDSKHPPNVIISNSSTSSENQSLSKDDTSNLTSDSSQIPEWIRNIFTWYSQGKISEKELLDALQVLIKMQIIKV